MKGSSHGQLRRSVRYIWGPRVFQAPIGVILRRAPLGGKLTEGSLANKEQRFFAEFALERSEGAQNDPHIME
jgi:hypothetical protein